ncbi:hypothetical protein CLOP_g5816, partial [Closterium sp. NIES-67]
LEAQVICVEPQLRVLAHLPSHLLRSSHSRNSNSSSTPFKYSGVHLLSNNHSSINSNHSNNSNSSNIHSNFNNSNSLNNKLLSFNHRIYLTARR